MNQTINPKPEDINFGEIATHINAVQKQFDVYQNACFTARTQEFFSLELCGEAGELANLEKKRWKGKTIAHEDLADEAADVFIALCNYSNSAGIDLGGSIAKNLAEIEQRRNTGTF